METSHGRHLGPVLCDETEEEGHMDGWWTDIEATVRAALQEHSELSVGEVATALGVSEPAAASLLRVLAADGMVRIVRSASPPVGYSRAGNGWSPTASSG